MPLLMAETLVVTMDEPCFLLVEVNLQSPGSRGWHRYQILTVVRDEKLANARVDLGPAKDYIAPQFRVIGGVHDEHTGKTELLHTVGELVDIADFQRAGMIRQPEIQQSDLQDGYYKHRDAVRLASRRVSQFGPRHRIQRGA